MEANEFELDIKSCCELLPQITLMFTLPGCEPLRNLTRIALGVWFRFGARLSSFSYIFL